MKDVQVTSVSLDREAGQIYYPHVQNLPQHNVRVGLQATRWGTYFALNALVLKFRLCKGRTRKQRIRVLLKGEFFRKLYVHQVEELLAAETTRSTDEKSLLWYLWLHT